ncbi:MAG: cupin domain-containing protein [Sphingomonadales bacterium]|jgi:quercetin dioxygenase-like cupin family protein|nr:cupin domain-containing protein [Sphingomonadales bacterium]MBK9005091.1 cupin domain-containing protein [Sphingomonadales bacterium]MBK9267176.1 cupin domain-containing protein [Sphingomonadales bacterium]
MTVRKLETFPLHLGLGATAIPQPEFTGGMDWYMAYGDRHDGDDAEGRLVSMHRFSESWPSWEMHPAGDEVVLCLSGQMVLHQEFPDQRTTTVTLGPGEYAINPPGVWHIADIDGEATALFITAGLGTEHRSR